MIETQRAKYKKQAWVSRSKQWIWRTIGVIALGLGIIGIPLPLLPTTPFLILAAYCFSRSSAQLHKWLMTHPRFSPPILAWQEHGAIPRKIKIASICVMIIGFITGVIFELPPLALILQATAIILVGLFIITRPGLPKINKTPETNTH